MQKTDLILFLKEVENKIENRSSNNTHIEVFDDHKIDEKECLYIFDLTKNKIVYHQGFDKLFGYNFKNLSIDDIFNNYHPNDAAKIKKIIRHAINEFLNIQLEKYSNILNISFRFKKQDNSFIKVLSKTFVFRTNENKLVTHVLINYKNISFLNLGDFVEWSVDSSILDAKKIHNSVYEETKDLFTSRELEIIKELYDGKSSREISKSLFISINTVATHRKNILFKSNCSGISELKIFCRKNGILTHY